MKKLPELYKNTNCKPKDNNRQVYYPTEKTKQNNNKVEDELTHIFETLGYSYNIPVKIITKDKVYHTSLVTKTKENVLTIDNEIIAIKDIIDIIRL